MIVVVGNPSARANVDQSPAAGGPGANIAIAAVEASARVEIVGRVGEDADGEGVLLDLARHLVGHVAVLRDAARPTGRLAEAPIDEGLEASTPDQANGVAFAGPPLEAADLQLALSYLPEYSVIVVAESLGEAALRVVADAAGWSGAALVVVGRPATSDGLPADVTIFDPPDDGDPDGAFAAMVGAYAAGLDRGDDPKAAFTAASAAVGSTAAE